MTRFFQPTAASSRSAGKSPNHRKSILSRSTVMAGWTGLALYGALGSLTFGSPAFAQSLPTGGNVSAGGARISGNASTMTINQSTQSAAINWQSFNIAAGNSVVFVQPNANAVALNRVLGPDPSLILGNLSANGKVFLVNPNGVLFGQGAQVNVGGIVASTLNISDADFMGGNYRFSGAGGGPVLNQGVINADGGYVALLGANVTNEGLIQARLGTAVLAAGEAVTLDVTGDGLLSVAIDTGAVNALVRNGGIIRADGGSVVMTAQAAGQLLHTVVNNSGIIEARALEGRAGSIVLLGDMHSGTMNVSGTLDAGALNGGDGGFIETSAANVHITDGAVITTAAPAGRTGNWLIDPQDFIIATTGGNISGATLSALLVTNSVTINTMPGSNATVAGTPPVDSLYTATPGNGDIFVNAAIAWVAAPNTTTLTLNAFRDVNVNAPVSATNGNFVVCCGRDANINAAITTVGGSVLVTAGHNVNLNGATINPINPGLAGVITTTDGNITLCAGLDVNINGAITLTRGTTIPAQSLGLPVGLLMIAGAGGTGPGIAGGTVIFAPLAPPITVTVAPVVVNYNPISYTAPNDYSTNFTLTGGAILTQRMLLFPGASKEFDGTPNVTLAGFNSTALSGLPSGVTLIAGPSADAVFDDPAVSGGAGVTFSGYSLSGTNAAQYSLAGGTCCTTTYRTTGIIIPAAVIPPVVVPPVVIPPVTPPIVIPPVTPPILTPPVVSPIVPLPVLIQPGVIQSGVTPPPISPGITPPAAMPPVTTPDANSAPSGSVNLFAENRMEDIESEARVIAPAASTGIALAMIGEGLRMPIDARARTISVAPHQKFAEVQPILAPSLPAVFLPEYAPKQDRH
jgi:filamentous hemagglutinin family protein